MGPKREFGMERENPIRGGYHPPDGVYGTRSEGEALPLCLAKHLASRSALGYKVL